MTDTNKVVIDGSKVKLVRLGKPVQLLRTKRIKPARIQPRKIL